MDNIGWVKIHRSLLQWEWWSDLPTRTLFITMLLMVNRQDKKWQGKVIKKGSFVTSREHLATLSGLSVQQVRRALDNLQTTSEITKQTTNQYTQIALLNWDLYQSAQPTNNQQTTNKQPQLKKIRKKEDKNIKKTNKKDFVVPDFIDKDIFDAYCDMRKKLKKPLTEHACKLAIDKLTSFKKDGYNPNEILNNSIMNSWQGLFEPKGVNNKTAEPAWKKKWR